MEIQWQLRRACVSSSLIGNRVYPSNRDCQMGIEFTRRRRAAGAAHAPSRRCDILFCLTHVIRTRAPVGRHRCRCTGRTVRVCERTRVIHRDLSRKPIPSTDRASCSHCLASGLARSAIGDVDRFPALDANAEITPCDPLDRLSGV